MAIVYEAFEAAEEEVDVVAELARKIASGMSHQEMLGLAGAMVKQHATAGATVDTVNVPDTKEALWHYIKDTWGVEISRTAVCVGHDAPFDFIWLGYSELVPNLFCIGPRGGGKSFDTALLMALNSIGKPGCESMVFGAVDDQNKKVYDDMVEHFITEDMLAQEPTVSLMKLTTGSVARSYPGTVAKMNGQHPPKAHAEEVEIFKPKPWGESRNMAADKVLKDGRRIKAQNFGTSTRKYKNGRVDKIFQGFLKAKARAIESLGLGASDDDLRETITMTSTWYCVIYCLFEIAAQVPNCRSAPENRGRPDDELCRCDEVINGRWDNGDDRTLESVCKGRLYRSRGHRSYGEVVQLFLQNDRGTWEAQQECAEAESEGLYIKSFSRNRHGLARFPYDPANGPIFTGTDWGFTDEAAVLWVQYLERPVEAIGYDGNVKVLPRGARVFLAEIHEPGLTATELGHKAIGKEIKLATVISGNRIPVRKRWADLQGAGDRKDWSKIGLKTNKYSTRSFEEHVKEMRGLFDADRAFVVVDPDTFTGMGCPNFCDQIEGWRQDDHGKESRDLPQHMCSAGRYVCYGMHDVYQDPGAIPSDEIAAAQAEMQGAGSAPAARAMPRKTPGGQRSPFDRDEKWRAAMGVSS